MEGSKICRKKVRWSVSLATSASPSGHLYTTPGLHLLAPALWYPGVSFCCWISFCCLSGNWCSSHTLDLGLEVWPLTLGCYSQARLHGIQLPSLTAAEGWVTGLLDFSLPCPTSPFPCPPYFTSQRSNLDSNIYFRVCFWGNSNYRPL